MSVTFIKSAVLPKDFPPDRGVEIAIAGRSNAGKSSLINLWTGSKIAKVSGTPGKTRLLNFFDIDRKYVLVDMPGYGWAARSQDEITAWQEMIENYLTGRESLKGMLLLTDGRREWGKDESQLKRFMDAVQRPLVVVLTKTDKMKKNEIAKAMKDVQRASGAQKVFPVSSQTKDGFEELEEWVYVNWVKPWK